MKTNFHSILSQQSSRLLVTFLILCAMLAGCSKKDDPAPQTKTEFLTSGTWKVSAFTSTDALLQSFGVLLVGSEYVFKTDGTMTYTVLGTAAGSGKWEFASSETKLIFNKGTATETTNQVVTLNNGNMELKETDGSVISTTKFTKK